MGNSSAAYATRVAMRGPASGCTGCDISQNCEDVAMASALTIDDELTMQQLIQEVFLDANQAQICRGTLDEYDDVVCPFSKEDRYVGDHVCERLGDCAVEQFRASDGLTRILKQCREQLAFGFEVDVDELTEELVSCKTTNYVLSVSDPHGKDCPLVYVSLGFEALTGYPADFTTGRSCRFLQPTNKAFNDWINLEDRQQMRSFCMNPQPTGKICVHLLLNERVDGTRFWNLLKMMYVEVGGYDKKQYIVAMQTVVDGFMPAVLRKKTNSEVANEKIAKALGCYLVKLKVLRLRLKGMMCSSLTALWAFVSEELDNMGKQDRLIMAPTKAASKAKAAAAKKNKKDVKGKAYVMHSDPHHVGVEHGWSGLQHSGSGAHRSPY